MRRFAVHLVLPVLVSLFEHAEAAAQSAPPPLKAVRVVAPITIDGILNEPEWQTPGVFSFIQREPDEGSPASERTEVWFAYDEDALYVAARMDDSQPDSIVALLARRDEDSESDEFTVYIDPSFDRRTGYFFTVNPEGTIADGTYSNDSYSDLTWDGVWDVAVSVDQHGWTAEFRIPYSQIRFRPKESYVWGVDASRRIKRKNEISYLVLHPRTDYVRVSRWRELMGLEGITPPARIELLPYVTATTKFVRQPPVHFYNAGRTDPFRFGRDYFGNLGADAKIGLSGDMTLDMSLNPDFAQVEVDPAVVNLTAYETQYAEKRPFFIEGSNILRFGRGGAASLQDFDWRDPDFFYSRRIGRAPDVSISDSGFVDTPDRTTIIGAAKVSGKITDTWSIAALTAVTDREYSRLDSVGNTLSEEVEPLTLYAVARSQKEFDGARHAIGVIATLAQRDNRTPLLQDMFNDRAISVGLDGWTFLDEKKVWVLTGWTGLSSVSGSQQRLLDLQKSPQHYFQRPDATYLGIDSAATSMTGWASRVWLDKVSGNFFFNAAVGAISPKFETNDLGYLRFSDFINAHLYLGYGWYEPDPVFRTKWTALAVFEDRNFGGVNTGRAIRLMNYGQFLNYWHLRVDFAYYFETFDDRLTRGGPVTIWPSSRSLYVSAGSDARQPLSGTLTATAAQSSAGAWSSAFYLTLLWKASRVLTVRGGPEFSRSHSAAQWITRITDPTAINTYGTRYIFAPLDQTTISGSLRVNWTFTPQLSLQAYLQPLLSTGRYGDFKQLARPRTYDFLPYTGSLGNPNFNYKSLRLNAVLRWEYLPGSTLYFVWTHEKSDVEPNGDFAFSRDFNTLMRDRPDNIFSLKLTYWWSP